MSHAFILFILKRHMMITFQGAAMLTPAVLFVSFFLSWRDLESIFFSYFKNAHFVLLPTSFNLFTLPFFSH